MYINKAIVYGNLTKEVELKSLPSGMKVASFSLATNRTWKDQNGQKQDAVEYHNVAAFGKTAELIGQYVKKGDGLYIEGRLQTRSWDDQGTGKKMYRTEIIAETMQFGNKRAPGAAGQEDTREPATEAKFENNMGSIDYGDVVNADDIPF